MWFTEILGRFKGEPVQLNNNPAMDWNFEPYAEVMGLFTMNSLILILFLGTLSTQLLRLWYSYAVAFTACLGV